MNREGADSGVLGAESGLFLGPCPPHFPVTSPLGGAGGLETRV